MKPARKPWTAIIAAFLCLLCLGLATAGNVVSQEGLDGLFKRKRDAVRQVMPEALPIVNEVEERVRQQVADARSARSASRGLERASANVDRHLARLT